MLHRHLIIYRNMIVFFFFFFWCASIFPVKWLLVAVSHGGGLKRDEVAGRV